MAIILFAVVIVVVTHPSFFSSTFPGVRAFTIPALSMAPTIQQSDRVLVNFLTYDRHDPARGDVVAVIIPMDSGSTLQIKRIIAISGDVFSISRGTVILNGNRLAESYTMSASSSLDPSQTTDIAPDFGPLTIPANKYFILGDYRAESYDSRYYGAIDRSQIRGKVIRVYHSANPTAGWQRIH
ncbi:MAG TPA: signal peptidase I [Candidatus Acidoferrales bacterium]|jgi:signal peptidase I|nr:signal peptidase I [Candidatus Acidoferrales bacterium]